MGIIVTVLMTILNLIIRLLSGLAKIIYKVCRFFGLHIPLFYLIVMLIIELVTNRGVSSNPEYVSLFWLGLLISLLLAGIYVVRKIFFPKRKRDEAYYRKKFEKEQREKEYAQLQETKKTEKKSLFDFRSNDVNVEEVNVIEPDESEEAPLEVQDSALFQEPQTVSYSEPPAKEEPPVRKKQKKPKVYRVRQDERFLIYEYEDRTELYFERQDGLKLIRTDPKF